MKKAFLALCSTLVLAGCAYNTETKQILPIYKPVLEMAGTVTSNVKECGLANSKDCKITTSHDNYEQSKLNAMSNEEMDEYIAKQKKK
jgi:hypothetical protein